MNVENLMQKDSSYELETDDDSSMMDIIIQYDGSTTKLIENLFGEPIEIECLSQGYIKTNEIDWSDLNENEKVLQRIVYLKGKESGIRYLYATSLIRTEYLEEKITHAILEGEKGIGELIQDYKLETYRELISSKSISNNISCSIFLVNCK